MASAPHQTTASGCDARRVHVLSVLHVVQCLQYIVIARETRVVRSRVDELAYTRSLRAEELRTIALACMITDSVQPAGASPG